MSHLGLREPPLKQKRAPLKTIGADVPIPYSSRMVWYGIQEIKVSFLKFLECDRPLLLAV